MRPVSTVTTVDWERPSPVKALFAARHSLNQIDSTSLDLAQSGAVKPTGKQQADHRVVQAHPR